MRSFVFVLLVFVLAVGSCAVGQDPVAIAEQQLQAGREGDWAEWRSLFDPDAVHVGFDGESRGRFEPREWVEEDFDGDGVKSVVDWIGFNLAFASVNGGEVTWDCTEIADDQAECTITETDRFLEQTGLGTDPYSLRYTIADGLISRTEVLPGADGIDTGESTFEEMISYERWVFDTYPDRWAELFRRTDGCCSWNVQPVDDNLAIHEELLEEYFQFIGFES